MNMTGRRILVTGASSGIGRACAIVLSQLGAAVVLSGRDEGRLQETYRQLEGVGHAIAAFDLAQLDVIPSWLKGVAAKNGPFHGLAHSAGLHNAIPLRVLGSAALDEMMRVNLHSAVLLARAFRQKGCRAPETSSLVFLASVAGLVGEPGVAAYSASKAALLGLTRSLAIELASEKIRVNAVAPGFVQSEMADRLKQTLSADQFAAIEKKHPLGLGTVGDVANSVAFLLGDCSRWITGTTLVIDGGYTAH